ncbi:MAG: hypothetical protein K2X61_14920 [Caulobacteraceae bacterium]|nr:hypothetical protein [Caulobacteraceae bacterium]
MIHYVVFDPATGEILRFGVCPADDLAAHGAHVVAFEADPGVTDSTHRVDPATRALIPLS